MIFILIDGTVVEIAECTSVTESGKLLLARDSKTATIATFTTTSVAMHGKTAKLKLYKTAIRF